MPHIFRIIPIPSEKNRPKATQTTATMITIWSFQLKSVPFQYGVRVVGTRLVEEPNFQVDVGTGFAPCFRWKDKWISDNTKYQFSVKKKYLWGRLCLKCYFVNFLSCSRFCWFYFRHFDILGGWFWRTGFNRWRFSDFSGFKRWFICTITWAFWRNFRFFRASCWTFCPILGNFGWRFWFFGRLWWRLGDNSARNAGSFVQNCYFIT